MHPIPVTLTAHSSSVDSYFEYISYTGNRALTLDTLTSIHRAHVYKIPFENLNPLFGLPVSLDINTIQKKIEQGRGGYCFEHNHLLMHALKHLGFEVYGLAARVLWNQPPNFIPPRGHMLLFVKLADKEIIMDVGFGGLTLPEPLLLLPDAVQETSHESFRFRKVAMEYHLEVSIKQEWRPLYCFTLQEQFLPDYQVINYWISTHPHSHFTHNLIAARVAEKTRYGLRNNEFSIHHLNGETEKRKIEGITELQDILENVFRINLSEIPKKRDVFQTVLSK